MDLLEIRKKAKQKKEAEEKAALEADKNARDSAGEPSPEAPVTEEVPALKDRQAKKKRPAAAKKPKKKAEAVSIKQPVEEPAPPQSPEIDEPVAGIETEVEITAAAKPPEDLGSRKEAPPEIPAKLPETATAEDELLPDEDADENDGNLVEYLAFRLSDEEYAVKVEDVKEIIRLQQITMVPRAQDFVEGIISLRGVVIPVFDIKKRLGLEQTERLRTARIVIVSENGSPQGIIVDKVTGVARLREDAIEPPPAVIGGVEGEYLEGVGRIDGRLLILFNTAKVLAMDSGVAG